MHRLVSIAIVCLCAIASASAQTRQIALTFDDAPRGERAAPRAFLSGATASTAGVGLAVGVLRTWRISQNVDA